jgi:hypothetical protein
MSGELSEVPDMNDILTALSKPVWWMSVVLAGIVMHLLSASLTSWLDTALSGTSSWWQRRSEGRRRAWEARVAELRASEEAQQVAILVEVRLRLQAIYLLLALSALLVLCVLTLFPRLLTRMFPVFMLDVTGGLVFLSFLPFQAAVTSKNALNEARSKAHNPYEPMERWRLGVGVVWRQRESEERSLMPASIGKMVTICGILVITLAMTPTGSRIDPHDPWVVTQWKWIQRALRQEQDATPVTINPLLFYLGILLSVVGYAAERGGDRGQSTQGRGSTTQPARKTSINIYVGNLAFTATETEVRQLFEGYGTVDTIRLLTDRATGQSRGFGFVEMPDDTQARAAIAGLNGTNLGGRPLTINEAHQRDERGGPRRGSRW